MLMHDLEFFIGGAIFLGDLVIALLFLRFWNRARDRLFAWFGIAFVILALERVLLFWHLSAENEPLVYTSRLIAFAFIIFGVIDRNRRHVR